MVGLQEYLFLSLILINTFSFSTHKLWCKNTWTCLIISIKYLAWHCQQEMEYLHRNKHFYFTILCASQFNVFGLTLQKMSVEIMPSQATLKESEHAQFALFISFLILTSNLRVLQQCLLSYIWKGLVVFIFPPSAVSVTLSLLWRPGVLCIDSENTRVLFINTSLPSAAVITSLH